MPFCWLYNMYLCKSVRDLMLFRTTFSKRSLDILDIMQYSNSSYPWCHAIIWQELFYLTPCHQLGNPAAFALFQSYSWYYLIFSIKCRWRPNISIFFVYKVASETLYNFQITTAKILGCKNWYFVAQSTLVVHAMNILPPQWWSIEYR